MVQSLVRWLWNGDSCFVTCEWKGKKSTRGKVLCNIFQWHASQIPLGMNWWSVLLSYTALIRCSVPGGGIRKREHKQHNRHVFFVCFFLAALFSTTYHFSQQFLHPFRREYRWQNKRQIQSIDWPKLCVKVLAKNLLDFELSLFEVNILCHGLSEARKKTESTAWNFLFFFFFNGITSDTLWFLIQSYLPWIENFKLTSQSILIA